MYIKTTFIERLTKKRVNKYKTQNKFSYSVLNGRQLKIQTQILDIYS